MKHMMILFYQLTHVLRVHPLSCQDLNRNKIPCTMMSPATETRCEGDIQAVMPVHVIIAWKMGVQGTFKQVKILWTECDFVIAKGKDHCITSSSLGTSSRVSEFGIVASTKKEVAHD